MDRPGENSRIETIIFDKDIWYSKNDQIMNENETNDILI
jgi:hypothetical protein